MVEQVVEEHTDQREPVGQIVSDVAELLVLQEMPLQAIPDKVHDQPSFLLELFSTRKHKN